MWHLKLPMNAFRDRDLREITISLFAVITIITFGTTGFTLIEGWHLFDSLYMTVITLSTVGFSEVHPLSDAGKAFAIFLILMGVGVVALVFSTITRFLLQRQMRWIFERKGMQQKIDEMSEHTIICGYGRLSRITSMQLKSASLPLIIIEKDPVAANLAESAGHLVLVGDATIDQTLLSAGIMRAKRLVSLLSNDADNLYVILASRELNKELFIMSRAEDEASERRLKRAGANRVMSPYTVGARKIADGILRPFVTDFIDVAVSDPSVEMQIEEIQIPQNSTISGKSLEQSEIRQKTNVIVAAMINSKGEMTFNPAGKALIEAGSILIALGLKNDLSKLEQLISGEN